MKALRNITWHTHNPSQTPLELLQLRGSIPLSPVFIIALLSFYFHCIHVRLCVCACVHTWALFLTSYNLDVYNLWELTFSLYIIFVRFIYIETRCCCCSFIWTTVQCPIGWLPHTLFTAFLGDRHWVCIQVFAIMVTITRRRPLYVPPAEHMQEALLPRKGWVGSKLLEINLKGS